MENWVLASTGDIFEMQPTRKITFDIFKLSVYNKYRKWQIHKRGFAEFDMKTHIELAKVTDVSLFLFM